MDHTAVECPRFGQTSKPVVKSYSITLSGALLPNGYSSAILLRCFIYLRIPTISAIDHGAVNTTYPSCLRRIGFVSDYKYECLFSLRIRRAVLEAASRSRKDFHTALAEFERWLDKMTANCRQLDADCDNPQLVKDSQKRKIWMDREKVNVYLWF